MLYAIRNAQGQITSLTATPQGDSGPVDIEDPEVIVFLSKGGESATPQEFLERSDHELGRILEDVIDLLVRKNAILFTDLPEEAQQKLLSRKLARSAHSKHDQAVLEANNSILTDDETI